jgi:hypothetical protein
MFGTKFTYPREPPVLGPWVNDRALIAAAIAASALSVALLIAALFWM